MKIALIAGGHLPIPPQGWGGVEHLIWNFHNQLTDRGHEVVLINTTNLKEVVNIVNTGNFDAVHLHYDQYSDVKCPTLRAFLFNVQDRHIESFKSRLLLLGRASGLESHCQHKIIRKPQMLFRAGQRARD